MKTAGFRIRVEPELRDAFVSICNQGDQSAAQVIRAFMRDYVDQHGPIEQRRLFVAEEKGSYDVGGTERTNENQ